MYRYISVYAYAFVTTWCHLCIYVQLSIHLSLESLYLCLYNMLFGIGYINIILLGKLSLYKSCMYSIYIYKTYRCIMSDR